MDALTKILQAECGDENFASEELLPLVYDEVRHLASLRMAAEAPGQTLQATALVHEVWLKIAGDGGQSWNNRTHFLRAAAQAMRRVLINYAESFDTVAANLGEVKPTVVLSVPRLYEKVYARVLENALSGSGIKRAIFFWAKRAGEQWATLAIAGLPIPGGLAFKKKSDADTIQETCGDCPLGTPERERIDSLGDTQGDYRTGALASFIAAGAFIGSGIVCFVLSSPSDEQSGVAVVPLPSLDGIAITGRF